jgi:hypothetical protein
MEATVEVSSSLLMIHLFFRDSPSSQGFQTSTQAQKFSSSARLARQWRRASYWHYDEIGIGTLLAYLNSNYPTTPASTNINHLTFLNHSHFTLQVLLPPPCTIFKSFAAFDVSNVLPFTHARPW